MTVTVEDQLVDRIIALERTVVALADLIAELRQ